MRSVRGIMPYILEPEVAGGWGEGTIANTSPHPPVVETLEYMFDGWGGDDLLATFPCFIVSEALATAIGFLALAAFLVVSNSVRFQFWLNPQSNNVYADISLAPGTTRAETLLPTSETCRGCAAPTRPGVHRAATRSSSKLVMR